MPNGAIVDAQGNITSVAGPEAQAPATPEAAPAQTRPKVGDAIETPEDQQAIRDALVPQPTPQNAASLPDDTTPQQAFLAFENTLAGNRFTTPLGDTVSFNEGHFGRVTCAGTPEGKDNPSKRKGFIAGYPSAQAARQALREGKVTADQIQGYQPGRAALIPSSQTSFSAPNTSLRRKAPSTLSNNTTSGTAEPSSPSSGSSATTSVSSPSTPCRFAGVN